MRRSICLVTSGHITSCPRIVKAADTAAADGWHVHVVAGSSLPWQRDLDRQLAATRRWELRQLEWGSDRAPMQHRWMRARFALARRMTSSLGAYAPWALVTRAATWPIVELARLAVDTRASFFYGLGGGGTVVAAAASGLAGTGFAVDFEDLHSEEGPPDSQHARLWRRIEDRLLHTATFVTGGSEAIAAAFARRAGREIIPIHNAMPLPASAPAIEVDNERVRFYWFGQTVGPERGLEECLDAMVRARLSASVTVRGAADPGYIRTLHERIASAESRVRLEHVPFGPADRMLESCAGFDVGLAFELGRSGNNRRALSNKCLTYVVAGLAPLTSRVEGTAAFVRDLGHDALTAAPDDRQSLEHMMRRLTNREALLAARHAAWNAAVTRWHWEHSAEQGRLVQALRSVA